MSIEREVWPQLVGHGLYGFAHPGAYWLDIGTPERYLQGTFDIIEGAVKTEVTERLGKDYVAIADGVEPRGRVVPPAVIERGCSVAEGAQVGSLVVLGDGVSIGRDARVERSVVMQGAEIGEGCVLRDCVVAAGAKIGANTQITGGAVLGEGVTVGADNVLTRGVRVFPHVELPDGAIRF